MTADDTLELFARERALAILRTPHADRAAPALAAAIRGGFRIVEVTLGTPGALELVAEFARSSDVVVGAGTVLEVADVERVVAHGARFVVSPVLDVEVVRAALSLGVVCIPGTGTPTEMLNAHRAGAQLVKLFPAPPHGPEHVRACLGPLPFLRIVPTSGVDRGNAARYLAAGAFALGFVGSLFEPEWVESGREDAIEARARELLEIVGKNGCAS